MNKINIKEIEPFIWEVEQNEGMIVPARIIASEIIKDDAMKDRSINQIMNVAALPGIQKYSVVMPDIHEGYGFPIGGVAAMDYDEGVISPGGIGYDINCGVRVLKTNSNIDDIRNYTKQFSEEIYKTVPSGVGKGGKIKLTNNELYEVLNTGCKWAVKKGYADESDLNHIESNGSLNSADAEFVSDRAKSRGFSQLGTMGAGNHFVEVNEVKKTYDKDIAYAYGLYEGQVVIQIHTGSRGLGHQVASDFIRTIVNSAKKYNISVPDRELSCVPIKSGEGKAYFSAMSAAANFAWTNRELISWEVKEAWRNVFGQNNENLSLLYDVAHNIAKVEEHLIDGKMKKVMVHRKGATRAFPKGHPELAADYKSVGQPVLIPGNMGTSSYILSGQENSMELTFGSACHGAGRMLSRTAARKRIDGKELLNQLQSNGIKVQAGSYKGLAEEGPEAYKDIENVINVVHNLNIAKKVAKLIPVAVIKG